MVVAMWVKKEDQTGAGPEPGRAGQADSESHQLAESSRSDSDLVEAGGAVRQSRREMYETRRAVEQHSSVTKSKSMSLKSQLKSPFKFLGKTYCGGCKVPSPSYFEYMNIISRLIQT